MKSGSATFQESLRKLEDHMKFHDQDEMKAKWATNKLLYITRTKKENKQMRTNQSLRTSLIHKATFVLLKQLLTEGNSAKNTEVPLVLFGAPVQSCKGPGRRPSSLFATGVPRFDQTTDNSLESLSGVGKLSRAPFDWLFVNHGLRFRPLATAGRAPL
jgi:hypothetical protein